MANERINEATPDTLMQRFQGSGLKKIIVFTLVAHVVILLGSSVPFLIRTVFGADTRKMSREERVTAAVQEATVAIRKIAGHYDLNPQDISERFSGGGTRAASGRAAPESEEETPVADEPAEPERPKSEIEKQLEVREDGPTLPGIEDDIF